MDTLHIPAACGIGTNLYLAKVALDITAKHASNRIGYLDETIYRKTLWSHRPITDFWRIGPGIAKRLSLMGIVTMQEVAMADSSILYQTFGVDAEYLIDHAWGREPVTIAEIKAYKAKSNSLSSGQVLMRDYDYKEGLLIVKEMTDLLCLDLVNKKLVTNSVSLHIGYSRDVLKAAGGTRRMTVVTNSVKIITGCITELYEQIINRLTPIRRITVTFNDVVDEAFEQYDLFIGPEDLEKDRKVQQAVLDIRAKFGKNSVIKGMNLLEAGTTLERNHQIGGHNSGE